VLGLPDIIARSSRSRWNSHPEANSCTVEERMCQRVWSATCFVLTALVNWQLFRCTKAEMSEMQYGLTPVSKLLVTENNPHNQAPVVLFQTDPAALAPWQFNSFTTTFCTVKTPGNLHMEK
jgi:hypothetical protein